MQMCSDQRNKNTTKGVYLNDFMKWHSVIEEQLIRMRTQFQSFSNKRGRFPPCQRLPCPVTKTLCC